MLLTLELRTAAEPAIPIRGRNRQSSGRQRLSITHFIVIVKYAVYGLVGPFRAFTE